MTTLKKHHRDILETQVTSSVSMRLLLLIIIIIRNLYSAIMPLGGYRGAGGTGR